MKIISEIKNIYKHFCMGEDNEGRVCCNQDFFLLVLERICWTHDRICF